MRAAVIGSGYIAREHLECLATLPGVETAAVCDLSPVLAESTAERYGIARWFTDHEKLLSEIEPDVVHVTTPPASHVRIAGDALRAGAHVLVEKPIALSPAELDALQDEAERAGLWLLEDHNYLFNPAVRRIRDRVAEGAFGDVVHVDVTFSVDLLGPGSRYADPNEPSPFSELPGGMIVDFVTHLAYLAHAFVGEYRSAHTIWRKRSDAPSVAWDEFRALVDAESGTAALGFSAHAQPDAFVLRVHGTRMRASASLFEPLLAIERVRAGPRPLVPVWNGLALARAHSTAAIGGLWRKLQGRPVTYAGLWELLSRTYAAIGDGAEPPIRPEAIRAVNALVAELLSQAPRP